MSVEFRKITRENFYPLLKLDPGDEGKFVASNAVSLAEAWLHYEAHDTHPFAIYHRSRTPLERSSWTIKKPTSSSLW